MKSVDQMLMDGQDRHSVLKTMPDRTDEEQVRVWSEGLGVIARRITQRTNNAKDALIDRARSRIVGYEHYLTKPFTKDELLSAIDTHVNQAGR